MYYYMIPIEDLMLDYSHGYIAACDADTMTAYVDFEFED